MRRLCLFFCLLCLSLAARADSFTPFTLNAAFNGGGTVTGTLTLDTTTNSFSSANLLVSGVGASFDGAYSSIYIQGSNVNYFVVIDGNETVLLNLPVGNLAGYTGGNICSQAVGCYNPTSLIIDSPHTSILATSGTLLPQATPTPEPSTLLSLATALTLGAYTQRRRLFA